MSLATVTHRKWLEKMARESDRQRLSRVVARLRDARSRLRSAKADARATCKAARESVRAWAKGERERLRAEIAKLKDAANQTCILGRQRVQENEGASVRDALIALEGERETRRMSRLARGEIKGAKTKKAAARRSAERRAEGDDDVAANLDDEQLIVWRKVKQQIKAKERATRLEVFQHWLHEHPQEVVRILEEHYQGDVDRLLREEQQQRDRMHVRYQDLTDKQLSARIEETARLTLPAEDNEQEQQPKKKRGAKRSKKSASPKLRRVQAKHGVAEAPTPKKRKASPISRKLGMRERARAPVGRLKPRKAKVEQAEQGAAPVAPRPRAAGGQKRGKRWKLKADGARFAVYPHAEWSGYTNRPVTSGRGYVRRELTGAVPYGRMQPLAYFTSERAADRYVDKLNGGALPVPGPYLVMGTIFAELEDARAHAASIARGLDHCAIEEIDPKSGQAHEIERITRAEATAQARGARAPTRGSKRRTQEAAAPVPSDAEDKGLAAAREPHSVIVKYSESGHSALREGARYPSIDAFTGALRRAQRAEKIAGRAYRKTGFEIVSELGNYTGRYDLMDEREEVANLALHVRRHLEHSIAHPEKFGMSEVQIDDARAWLAFVNAVDGTRTQAQAKQKKPKRKVTGPVAPAGRVVLKRPKIKGKPKVSKRHKLSDRLFHIGQNYARDGVGDLVHVGDFVKPQLGAIDKERGQLLGAGQETRVVELDYRGKRLLVEDVKGRQFWLAPETTTWSGTGPPWDDYGDWRKRLDASRHALKGADVVVPSDPKRTTKRTQKMRKKEPLRVERIGARSYIFGDTFAVKNVLRAEGFRWDRERKGWWAQNDAAARVVLARLNASEEQRETTEQVSAAAENVREVLRASGETSDPEVANARATEHIQALIGRPELWRDLSDELLAYTLRLRGPRAIEGARAAINDQLHRKEVRAGKGSGTSGKKPARTSSKRAQGPSASSSRNLHVGDLVRLRETVSDLRGRFEEGSVGSVVGVRGNVLTLELDDEIVMVERGQVEKG